MLLLLLLPLLLLLLLVTMMPTFRSRLYSIALIFITIDENVVVARNIDDDYGDDK